MHVQKKQIAYHSETPDERAIFAQKLVEGITHVSFGEGSARERGELPIITDIAVFHRNDGSFATYEKVRISTLDGHFDEYCREGVYTEAEFESLRREYGLKLEPECMLNEVIGAWPPDKKYLDYELRQKLTSFARR